MNKEFLFEVPSGEPISIEPFHYCIVGQTQFSGKTTLIKRLGEWAVDLGYKILVFDTKETEADYADFGNEVPVCLRETTDSFVLIGLLESMFRRRLTPYYATLSRLTEGAKGFDDIISRAKDLEAKTKSNWLRDACRVLYDLLERLQNETAKVTTVPQLRLNNGINRMDINQFSLEAQQLIVKNSFEDALRVYKRNLVLVIDEAFKFIPQGYSSAATRAIMNVMTQGAKTGLFGWISTQFLATTDKDPLKACAVKFLGTQDHTTEIKHTLDLIPEVRGKFSPDNIMKLKLGHWILVRKRPMYVGIVYALPWGIPEDVGRKVALGELTPEHVRDQYLVKVMEENEMVWKEKFDKLKKEVDEQIRILQGQVAEKQFEVDKLREQGVPRSEAEKRVTELATKLTETSSLLDKTEKERDFFSHAKDELTQVLKEKEVEVSKLKSEIEQVKASVQTLREWKDKVVEQLGEKEKELANLQSVIDEAAEIKSALGVFAKYIPLPQLESKTVLNLEHSEMVVNLSHREHEVKLTTETQQGQIMYVAINDMPKEGFTEKEISRGLKEHGWNIPHTSLAPQLSSNLVKSGLLVKVKEGRQVKYRLPTKLKINIAKD